MIYSKIYVNRICKSCNTRQNKEDKNNKGEHRLKKAASSTFKHSHFCLNSNTCICFSYQVFKNIDLFSLRKYFLCKVWKTCLPHVYSQVSVRLVELFILLFYIYSRYLHVIVYEISTSYMEQYWRTLILKSVTLVVPLSVVDNGWREKKNVLL